MSDSPTIVPDCSWNTFSGFQKQGLRTFLQRTASVTATLLLAMTAGHGLAQTRYRIDPSASQVQFVLQGIHTVHGHFSVSSGDVTFDRTTGAMSGSIAIAAASGDSGDSLRDKRMDKEELKVKKFPVVTFAPAKFTGSLAQAGSSTIQVEGTLTLLGTPHPITLPMTVDIQGTNCTARGTFQIPYVEWGLKDPSNFLMHMEKQVTIILDFKGTLSR
jgi:polyisoprenoid-binding protein YceI